MKEDSVLSLFDQLKSEVNSILSSSIFGAVYENLLILFSVSSCLQFIYQTYLHTDSPQLQTCKLIEKTLAGIFTFDWCLSFLLADHKLIFLKRYYRRFIFLSRFHSAFSFFSMVDLMTVIPIWVTYNEKFVPEISEIDNFHDGLTYFMSGLATTRILRALRIRKKINAIRDPVDRFIGEIALILSVLILFDAALIQYLERSTQPFDYHVWMYYIWVTIATVGYGDITPKSTLGRFAAMGMIGFAIISVPKMSNELIEKMAMQSVYARAYYQPKSSKTRHVLICGNMKSCSVRDLFGELFHEDHDLAHLDAVVLQPETPSGEVQALLHDPKYSLNVFYLEGSSLKDEDLKRAKAHRAVAIFILTDKFSQDPDEEDSKTILQQVSLRRFISEKSNLSALFCVQMIRPENIRHLGLNELSRDLVVCLNELKMGVLAKSVVYPGSSALILNLMSSFSDSSPDEEGNGDDEEDQDLDSQLESLNWISEYKRGCDWEVYTTELAPEYSGLDFALLSFTLHESLGILLFGLQIKDLHTGETTLILNPKNFVLPPPGRFRLEAFVLAQDKARSDLSEAEDLAVEAIESKKPVPVSTTTGALIKMGSFFASSLTKKQPNRSPSSSSSNSSTSSSSPPPSPSKNEALSSKIQELRRRQQSSRSRRKDSIRRFSVGGTMDFLKLKFTRQNTEYDLASGTEVIEAPPPSKSGSSFNLLKSPPPAVETPVGRRRARSKNLAFGLGIQKMMEREQEEIAKLEEKHFHRSYYVRISPVELSEVTIRTSVMEELRYVKNHIVIMGKGLSNLFDLIRPLRAKVLGECRSVVILSDEPLSHALWQRISVFEAVFFVRGSSLEEADILRTGIFRASQVVILANTTAAVHRGESSDEALIDCESIFAYQCVKRLNPHVQVLIEIVKQKNVLYLDNVSASYHPEDFKLIPQFASGSLFTTCLLDTIVCQAYYNPLLLKVLNKLICMVEPFDSDKSESDGPLVMAMNRLGGGGAGLDSKSERPLSSLVGSSLHQFPVPDDVETYGQLFSQLSSRGIIPLALLRGLAPGMKEGPKGNNTPYVYTNPDPRTKIFSFDKVFVLSIDSDLKKLPIIHSETICMPTQINTINEDEEKEDNDDSQDSDSDDEEEEDDDQIALVEGPSLLSSHQSSSSSLPLAESTPLSIIIETEKSESVHRKSLRNSFKKTLSSSSLRRSRSSSVGDDSVSLDGSVNSIPPLTSSNSITGSQFYGQGGLNLGNPLIGHKKSITPLSPSLPHQSSISTSQFFDIQNNNNNPANQIQLVTNSNNNTNNLSRNPGNNANPTYPNNNTSPSPSPSPSPTPPLNTDQITPTPLTCTPPVFTSPFTLTATSTTDISNPPSDPPIPFTSPEQHPPLTSSLDAPYCPFPPSSSPPSSSSDTPSASIPLQSLQTLLEGVRDELKEEALRSRGELEVVRKELKTLESDVLRMFIKIMSRLDGMGEGEGRDRDRDRDRDRKERSGDLSRKERKDDRSRSKGKDIPDSSPPPYHSLSPLRRPSLSRSQHPSPHSTANSPSIPSNQPIPIPIPIPIALPSSSSTSSSSSSFGSSAHVPFSQLNQSSSYPPSSSPTHIETFPQLPRRRSASSSSIHPDPSPHPTLNPHPTSFEPHHSLLGAWDQNPPPSSQPSSSSLSQAPPPSNRRGSGNFASDLVEKTLSLVGAGPSTSSRSSFTAPPFSSDEIEAVPPVKRRSKPGPPSSSLSSPPSSSSSYLDSDPCPSPVPLLSPSLNRETSTLSSLSAQSQSQPYLD